ncbi:unnamed protein product, partial [Medioppia subpectinata]
MCLKAESAQMDAFKCIAPSVFYYDTNRWTWDEARQMCSQKFDAIYEADLMQLTDASKSAAQAMMDHLVQKGLIASGKSEFATSGVCCMRKLANNRYGPLCQWLPSGDPIDGLTSSDQCHIHTVKYDTQTKVFINADGFQKVEDKSFDGHLCAFNAPKGCMATQPPPPSPTSFPSDTTTATSSDPSVIPTHSPDEVKKGLDELDERLKHLDLNVDQLLDCSEKLTDILKGGSLVTDAVLNQTLNIIDTLQQRVPKKTKDPKHLRTFTEHVVQSCSDVLESERAWDKIDHDQVKANFSSNILHFMQRSSFALGCREPSNTTNSSHEAIHKDNIVVQTFTMDYSKETTFLVKHMASSIKLPAGIPEPPRDQECIPGTAVGAVIDKLSRYLSVNFADKHELNSDIVAFSVANNQNSTQLPANVSPVVVTVKHNNLLTFGDKVQCVYWDFQQMKWSSSGCQFRVEGSDRKVSVCECNHLTNFAALMDVSGREANTKVKDILTKVCCGLSIICLVLTIGFL